MEEEGEAITGSPRSRDWGSDGRPVRQVLHSPPPPDGTVDLLSALTGTNISPPSVGGLLFRRCICYTAVTHTRCIPKRTKRKTYTPPRLPTLDTLEKLKEIVVPKPSSYATTTTTHTKQDGEETVSAALLVVTAVAATFAGGLFWWMVKTPSKESDSPIPPE
ncbi:hypothetical protein HK102_004339 [Quaeritorhiza haematococci]|nr:hypothetical protein HK102_004339 [Quaeritorhiza haematococci]